MNDNNNVISLEEAKKSRKRFTRSLEYELIAGLAVKQFSTANGANFEALLSIPLAERIPALVNEYGLKRIHRLVKTILNEFCHSVALSKSKKLTDTKISVVACDLILVADEDQFSMEDLIVFFEMAKNGAYGKFKTLLTHYSVMGKLEQFRQERYENYIRIKEKKEAEVRLLGPAERISPEPTPIKQLFEEGKVIPFKQDRLNCS
ncbi:MAG: hypothetical protein ACXVBJ_03800 [Flavisolibacter sp.]